MLIRKAKKYRFISDPGHAWLEVPIYDIPDQIRARISGYSYFKDGMAYLEEDCDAPLFLNSISIVTRPDIEEVYQENTPIRDYPHFPETLTNTMTPETAFTPAQAERAAGRDWNK